MTESVMGNLTKLTPIHTRAKALDAEFGFRAGWCVVESFSHSENEVTAASNGVSIADDSARGKLAIEGDLSETIVQTILGAPNLKVSAGASFRYGHVYRLRDDSYYACTSPGLEANTLKALTAATQKQSGLVTITDITHGSAELRVIGPDSRALLSRLCGLDFSTAAFPNLTAMQSSVAKTTQIVIRCDVGHTLAFALIGARSLAAYLWDTLMEAGRDLTIIPIGQTVLADLETSVPRNT